LPAAFLLAKQGGSAQGATHQLLGTATNNPGRIPQDVSQPSGRLASGRPISKKNVAR